jgi:hypothetical protein
MGPEDVEIFADEIDAKVAARVFNWAYLFGARSAVVERDNECHSYRHNRSRLAATSVVVPLFFTGRFLPWLRSCQF